MEKLDRRTFLGTGAGLAAASAFTIVPRHVLGGAGFAAPSDKLNIAGIGVGGMGAHNLKAMAGENITALCDVDHIYAAKTFAEYPNARLYKDYRELLDKEKDVDAVLIATPDHTHAVITLAALRAGKHVYCQKPLTHTVFEARKVAEEAAKSGLRTQMGIQGHSSDDMRKLCEWVWSGAIGPVRKVAAWSSICYYPWGHAYWSSQLGVRPTETPPLPEGMDWDLWIGPAPMRPYHPTYHPLTWRSWHDFGCSMMGDRGVHTLDVIFWALKLGAPETIEASCTDLNDETHPVAGLVRFNFPARGDMPPVELMWYDGLMPPGYPGIENSRLLGENEGGILMEGDDGFLTAGIYANSPMLLPQDKFKGTPPAPESIPRVRGSHEQEWINAIKEDRPACAGFDYAGPLTEMCLLGNVAKRVPGVKLHWDAASMTFKDNEKATKFVHKAYREGWAL